MTLGCPYALSLWRVRPCTDACRSLSPRLLCTIVFACEFLDFGTSLSSSDLTSNAVDPTALSNLTTQHELATAWSDLGATSLPTEAAQVHVLASIEEAVELVRKEGVDDALVTGSLHLVGGVMAVAWGEDNVSAVI